MVLKVQKWFRFKSQRSKVKIKEDTIKNKIKSKNPVCNVDPCLNSPECCTCKVVFLLIRSIVVVFSVFVAFNLSLVFIDFIFSLRNP